MDHTTLILAVLVVVGLILAIVFARRKPQENFSAVRHQAEGAELHGMNSA